MECFPDSSWLFLTLTENKKEADPKDRLVGGCELLLIAPLNRILDII